MRPVAPRWPWLWPVAIIASALVAGLLNLADVQSPVRVVSALWFLLVCPGMAIVRVLHLRDPIAEWTLAIGLSLGLDALVAEAVLYAGVWSPTSTLLALMGVSIAAAGLELVPGATGTRARLGLGRTAASSLAAAPAGAPTTGRAADDRPGEPADGAPTNRVV